MSHQRCSWWGYVKCMIRSYPARKKNKPAPGLALHEFEAVERAIAETSALETGAERLQLVSFVFWRGFLVAGAAQKIHVSERTAAQWHGDFIRTVAKHFHCDGLQ